MYYIRAMNLVAFDHKLFASEISLISDIIKKHVVFLGPQPSSECNSGKVGIFDMISMFKIVIF